MRRVRCRQLSSDPEVVAELHERMVCVLSSVIPSKCSGNSHVSDETLHNGENGGRSLIAGAVQALEAGGAIHKHYDVSRSPERYRERTSGVNADKLHRPLGARRRMMGSWCPSPLCHGTCRARNQLSRQTKTVLSRCCLQSTCVGMGEGDMAMVNIYHLTMLHHARVQGGRCQKTIRLKKGFPPELVFSKHRTHGGKGDRFQQIITRCIGPQNLRRTRNL